MDESQGQIGPHEDKEFELFKFKKKDVIYFQFDYQPEGHKEAAEALGAETLIFTDITFKLPSYIYYRKGHLSEAEELRDIMNSGLNMHQLDWIEKEYRIGELLGYSKNDVEVFIERFKSHHDEKH